MRRPLHRMIRVNWLYSLLFGGATLIVATPFLFGESPPTNQQVDPIPVESANQNSPPVNTFKLRTPADLKKQYPIESLEERLSYESDAAERPAPKVGEEAERRLAASEGENPWPVHDVRAQGLKSLHTQTADEFVAAYGFGRGRIIRMPTYRSLDPSPAEPLRLTDAPPLTTDEDHALSVKLPKVNQGVARNPLRMPAEGSLDVFHRNSERSFLWYDRFGYVKDRKHVAGFEAHSFVSEPDLTPIRPKDEFDDDIGGTEEWLLKRLELVSLLKHDTPRVYLSEHLPSMEELAEENIRTRAPTEVESRGVKRLQAGEDVVFEATPNRIRMIGALRAAKQCLECHQAHRGELLGAFSYELQRDPPVAVKRSALDGAF